MNAFNVTILGCNSAIPTFERNPTTQLVTYNNSSFLIDCSEGTQLALRRNHISFNKINRIFISHLHGDHYFGLIALISTMHLLGRRQPLTVYGPPKLLEIIQLQLDVSETRLQYPFHFVETNHNEFTKLFENKEIEVYSFPLLHSIPTTGFLFREKPQPRNLKKEIVEQLNIHYTLLPAIQKGADYTDAEGKLYANDYLTLPARRSRSYAFCSDTAYNEAIIPLVTGVDLLYHETTFMNNLEQNATEKFHSTTRQAATIALKAGAKKLIIGHYSARYDSVEPLLNETREVFTNCETTFDGARFDI
jgi:ribonuclease Z